MVFILRGPVTQVPGLESRYELDRKQPCEEAGEE